MAPSLHFSEERSRRRQQVPRLVAKATEIEAERSRTFALEDLLRAPQLPGIKRRRYQAIDGHALLILGRMQADEYGVELRIERVGASEDAQLPLLGDRLWREAHLAAPDEHQAGDPRVALHQIRESVLQGDVHVRRGDCQTVRGESL